jgi:serine/threonine protein kinase
MTVDKMLGKGVFLVKSHDGQPSVLKICKVSPYEDDDLSGLKSKLGQLENEIELLCGPLKGCPGVPTAVYRRIENHVLLFIQPVGVPLCQFPLPLDENERDCMIQSSGHKAAEVVCAIHERGVMHRDIKPDNIVVLSDDDVMVIDFGVSILFEEQYEIINTSARAGTLAYGSDNLRSGRPHVPSDDFESLAFSLHALRVGIQQWFKIAANDDISFEQLCTTDPVAIQPIADHVGIYPASRTPSRLFWAAGVFVLVLAITFGHYVV